MDLILEIETPGNGKVYEFKLDDSLTVGSVKTIAVEEIRRFENGSIGLDEATASLFHVRTQRIPAEALPLPDAQIRGGDRLLLL